MDHNFTFGGINPAKCARCGHFLIDHTNAATCEACGKMGVVELFGEPSNPKHMLLCASCIQKEIDTAIKVGLENEKKNGEERIREANERVLEAKAIDESIRYSKDFHNACTIAFEKVRADIMSGPGDEPERKRKLHEFMYNRLLHFDKAKERLDDAKRKIVVEEQIYKKSLREMKHELSTEFLNKIKQIDEKAEVLIHQPVVPKVKKKQEGTFDRMVSAYMLLHDCTRDEALEAIRKGSSGKFGNMPIQSK